MSRSPRIFMLRGALIGRCKQYTTRYPGDFDALYLLPTCPPSTGVIDSRVCPGILNGMGSLNVTKIGTTGTGSNIH